jgi:hypothetical protein
MASWGQADGALVDVNGVALKPMIDLARAPAVSANATASP